MATDNHEYRQAAEAAASHRQRAGELYARHRSEGKDELLSQAKAEHAKAAHFEEKAQKAQDGKKQDTFQKDGEAAGDSDRRAWYEPGSVADDKMLQFEEAKQGGILDEVTKYAARSVFDKDHRKFEGAKAIGKMVSAPEPALVQTGKAATKGAAAVGRGVSNAARVGKAAARGVAAVGRGASDVVKGTSSVGRQLLNQAAEHRKEPRFAPQGGTTEKKAVHKDSPGRGPKARGQHQKPGRTRSAKIQQEQER